MPCSHLPKPTNTSLRMFEGSFRPVTTDGELVLMCSSDRIANSCVAAQNPGAKTGQETQKFAPQQVQVPLDTEQLVHALNEHVRGLRAELGR